MSLFHKVNGDNHFVVDEANSDEQYCYIDLPGVGTVSIKRENEGVVVDIFSLHVSDEPVASCYAFYSDLLEDSDG